MASLRSMTKSRFRAAVSPLRRRFEAPEPGVALPLVDDIVAVERPSEPVHCLRPATIVARGAAASSPAFPGDVLYAVKCNPDPRVLRAVWEGGVRHFDCASLPEIALVRQMFRDAAVIHFMHPVKARAAIREAYRSASACAISSSTAPTSWRRSCGRGPAGASACAVELGLVRAARAAEGRRGYDLSGKFGAEADEAAALLRAARPHAATARPRLPCRLAVPRCRCAYARGAGAGRRGDRAVRVSRSTSLDVGGGFPVSYPDGTPPARRIHRRDRGGGGSAGRALALRLVGRAGPRAGRGRRVGGRAGAGCGGAMRCTSTTASTAACRMRARRVPLPGAADPSGWRGAVAAIGLRAVRADLRQRRPDAGPVRAAGRRRARATGSRSASSAPTAPACAPRSTASTGPALVEVRGRGRCSTPGYTA